MKKSYFYGWLIVFIAGYVLIALKARETDQKLTALTELVDALEWRENAQRYKANARFLLHLKYPENAAIRDTLITDLETECLNYNK